MTPDGVADLYVNMGSGYDLVPLNASEYLYTQMESATVTLLVPAPSSSNQLHRLDLLSSYQDGSPAKWPLDRLPDNWTGFQTICLIRQPWTNELINLFFQRYEICWWFVSVITPLGRYNVTRLPSVAFYFRDRPISDRNLGQLINKPLVCDIWYLPCIRKNKPCQATKMRVPTEIT